MDCLANPTIVAALIALAGGYSAVLANHRLELWRAHRKEFNELARAIHETLVNSDFRARLDPREAERLALLQPLYRRRACRIAAEAYARAHQEETGQDERSGSLFLKNPERVKQAGRAIERFEGLGYRVYKVPVEPEQFLAWCARSGVKPDRDGRAAFAAHAALKKTDH